MNADHGHELADTAERARLTPSASRAAERLREAWSLSDEQFGALLGARVTIDAAGELIAMSEDELVRVGLLAWIYVALHRLHGQDLADAWLTQPNTNPLFHGQTPLEAMTLGGLTAIIEVHQLLTARVAGHW